MKSNGFSRKQRHHTDQAAPAARPDRFGNDATRSRNHQPVRAGDAGHSRNSQAGGTRLPRANVAAQAARSFAQPRRTQANAEPRGTKPFAGVQRTPPPAQSPRVAIDPAQIASSPFSALGLVPELVRAVLDEGYTTPTPVQAQVVGPVLAGRDVQACAQTGTGKTAAFLLPLLQRLSEARAGAPGEATTIRVLILTPTRELAAQIDERVSAYGRHGRIGHAVIFGGVSQHRQELALSRNPQVLVATPGRLLDLMRQGVVRLDGVTELVLDEADRMLDMGFLPDVRTICAATSRSRQTLLFSATMPAAIESLARKLLRDPVRVAITPAVTTATGVEQSVMFVPRNEKRAALERILADSRVLRAIVFTATKRGANRLADQLVRAGIDSAAIHGNKSQAAREKALDAFRHGRSRVLVATDVASRGIDVDGVSHVINFELPDTPESYVHRIGRTGRAGATGEAISFCDPEERQNLQQIERFIKRRLSIRGSDADTRRAEPSAQQA